MERSDILTKVIEILKKRFDGGGGDISEDTRFVEELGADSLDIVEIVMTLETEFNIVIKESDVEKLKSVKDVVEYIESIIANKNN